MERLCKYGMGDMPQVRRTAVKQDVAAAATVSAAVASAAEGSAVAGAKVASTLVLKLMEDQFECSVCREWLCAAHSVVSHLPGVFPWLLLLPVVCVL